MRFIKPIAATLALAIGAVSLTSAAEARHRHRHGDAFAAGIAGFAAGALLGALSQPRYPRYPSYYYYEPAPVYVAPPPRVYYYQQPAPAYYNSVQPWTPEWYAYCDARYRSFNASTGYFLGYDGQYHFCR
jgi:hypothetical protein